MSSKHNPEESATVYRVERSDGIVRSSAIGSDVITLSDNKQQSADFKILNDPKAGEFISVHAEKQYGEKTNLFSVQVGSNVFVTNSQAVVDGVTKSLDLANQGTFTSNEMDALKQAGATLAKIMKAHGAGGEISLSQEETGKIVGAFQHVEEVAQMELKAPSGKAPESQGKNGNNR